MSEGRVDPSVGVALRSGRLATEARRFAELRELRGAADRLLADAGLDPSTVQVAAAIADLDAVWAVLRQGLTAVGGPMEQALRLAAARRDDDARRHKEGVEEERRLRPVLELAPGVTMAFVLVPEGPFKMGSDKNDSERPVHEVTLDANYIGKYPVTKAQFGAFVAATKYRCDDKAIADLRSKADHPVTHVSWDDAVAFCAWAGKATGFSIRLPTEAEWEKAARGTDGREYPWGNEKPDDSRCRYGKWTAGTTPVGSFSPRGDSPYGAVDMAGNVWEWCADWYDSSFYKASPSANPAGPRSGDKRVARGGSWHYFASNVSAAHRISVSPDYRQSYFGFRVACSI